MSTDVNLMPPVLHSKNEYKIGTIIKWAVPTTNLVTVGVVTYINLDVDLIDVHWEIIGSKLGGRKETYLRNFENWLCRCEIISEKEKLAIILKIS